jgi:hypothetical protein
MELDESVSRFPSIGREGFELFALCAIAVFAPMLVTQQLLLGTIVNATLVFSALRISGPKAYVPAFIPSIITVMMGLVLGQPAAAVAAMLPFIWLGNATLMFIMRKVKDAYWKAIAAAAATKAAMLFASSLILVYFAGLPAQILAAFGMIQFVTAMLGGALAYAMIKAKN